MKPLLISFLFLISAASVRADVSAIENQYRAAYELHVGPKSAAAEAELDAKYVGALERAMASATQGQRLDEALALRDEIQRVKDKVPLPSSDDGVVPALAKFRGTSRGQLVVLADARQKAAAPIIEQFGAALAAYQEELTKAGKLDEAFVVRDYRATDLAEKLTGKPLVGSLTVATAAPEKPFENSLGMRFLPVPIVGGPTAGKTIRFSIWETRVKDYAAFAKDAKRDPAKPNWKQTEDHPAALVSWDDATAFCEWLTKEERRKRKIGPKDVYRLPTDHEWSCAAGIGKDADASASPVAKAGQIAGYPWGPALPPSKVTGNYYGEETVRNPAPERTGIPGYDDGFDRTAPVGSYAANSLGIFDLSGNLVEWCQEWLDPANPGKRVVRGGSWSSPSESSLMWSYRSSAPPNLLFAHHGFRVVLEVGTGG